ncbi:MAG: ABC transporter substrate-binding protein [Hyphomicrobiaceae bacterium]|nr:ABC transporter substrate-binding protein [Hyphomicrobiaceae bacterium]
MASSAAFALAPSLARAQASDGRLRRIGVMMAVKETDAEGQQRLTALRRALEEAGWADKRNIVIDARWYEGNFAKAQEAARSLVENGTDLVVVNGTPGMDAMRSVGAQMPIIFVVVSNPVGAGYVSNLARPGANITGFSTFEPEIAGKWLQILRQLNPGLKHVSMLLDPKFKGFNSLWQGVEEIAPQFAIAATPAFASTLEEIEREVEKVAAQPNSALIVAPSPVNTVNRLRLIALANRKRLPTIYPFRFYVRDGALVAYGFNAADQFRRAAAYVDRVLKGEKAGELPVQAPSLFELGINVKTARDIGVAVPQALLIAADEIVE